MKFIISKLLLFICYPLFWVAFLWTWSLLTQKTSLKKRLTKWSIVLLLFFSNEFIFNQVCLLYQPQPIAANSLPKYKVGIILGGLSSYDKNEQGYFNWASDRFIQTLKLYKMGKIEKIIVSGGSAKILKKEKDEASFLYNEFKLCGVNESDLIIESRSRNTEENMIFSKIILDSLRIKDSVIIITSAIHAPRSSLIAKKLQVKHTLLFPCNFMVANRSLEWDDFIIPKPRVLQQWGFLIKEWLGIFVYKILGKE